MKTFEFDETQLGEIDKIALQLFKDENDPRSISYKRIIVRPKINWFGLIAWVVTPVIVVLMLYYFFYISDIEMSYLIGTVVVLYLLYFAGTARWFVVCMIKLYQHFAPEKVRMKCRFEPSCSEYMIQAIRKYGLFKGVKRGWNRLGRCNVSGGGYDEP